METKETLYVVFCNKELERKREILSKATMDNATTLLIGSPKKRAKFMDGIKQNKILSFNMQNVEDSNEFYGHFMAVKIYISSHPTITTVVPIGTNREVKIFKYLWEKNPREKSQKRESCITGESLCSITIGKERNIFIPISYRSMVGIKINRFLNLYKKTIYDIQERTIIRKDLKKFRGVKKIFS